MERNTCKQQMLEILLPTYGTPFLCGITLNSRGDEIINLTVDHKVSNAEEMARLKKAGVEVNEGQTRISGLAVSRSLGDRFLKKRDTGLISVPYVSSPIQLQPSDSYLLIASDGVRD